MEARVDRSTSAPGPGADPRRAASAASAANLAGAGLVATADMTIHYMAPGRVGPVRAISELLHQGTRGTTVETRVYDTGRHDRLMATALASFAPLTPGRSPD